MFFKNIKNSLGIPASSAAVERLFSIAGKIYRPERCQIGDTCITCIITVASLDDWIESALK